MSIIRSAGEKTQKQSDKKDFRKDNKKVFHGEN